MEGLARVFEHLTAHENFISGAHTRRDTGQIKRDIELVYDVLSAPEGTPRRCEPVICPAASSKCSLSVEG